MGYALVVLLAGVTIVVVIVCHQRNVIVCHQRNVAKFNERFPPIDDDEFVRRCGPGVNRDVAIRVRRIVSEQLGIEYERVYPDQKFVDDLYCD